MNLPIFCTKLVLPESIRLESIKSDNMKTRKVRKRLNKKERNLQKNIIDRFIREIEREEPLEADILNSMVAFQPLYVR